MRLRTLLAAWLAAATLPALALASSHSEAPGTSKDRLADDTDLYAWVAADAVDAVTIVGNWVPLIEPNGGPNFASFDDEVSYYVNIDNVGDAQRHIRYQFRFTTTVANPATFLYNTGVVGSIGDPDLNVRQTYTVTRWDDGTPTVLATGLPVAPNFVGPVSMPDYDRLAAEAVQTLPDGTRLFVGPRDDPFFVDLAATFDLLTIRRPPGDRGKGIDGVGGFNVMSIVMQIPKTRLTRDGLAPSASLGNHILGIWDTAERFATRTINADGSVSLSGTPVQVSRLGMPLVNEVVIPLGGKDKFNRSQPIDDVANFGASVVDPELAKLLTLLYGIAVPPAPRTDIVAVFATGVPGLNQPANVVPGEMLRLNLTIPPAPEPKRLGVLAGDLAGFPNGRRLTDDVVDIEERVVAGVLVPGFNVAPNNRLGDGVNVNDRPFLPYFPYVAPPHNPLEHRHHLRNNANGGTDLLAALDRDDAENGDLESESARDEEAGAPAPAAPAGRPGLRFAGPNPGPAAELEFTLTRAGRVSLKVYDLQGRELRTLVDQDAAAGTFRARWDGRRESGAAAGPGVFFARFTVDGQVVDRRKIVLE